MTGKTAVRSGASIERTYRLKVLLLACANGNKRAFEQLYERTSTTLFKLLMRILKRPDLAQDCLQEVYLKIWNNAGEYRSNVAAPLTWMSSIARYQAFDLLRRRRREVEEDRPNEVAWQAGFENSVEDAIAENSDRDRLESCLRMMNSDHRQIFSLAYFRGLSHTEVAQQTDLPMGTVKTWISRGLKSLRQCMHA